jgi:hypothetical protein
MFDTDRELIAALRECRSRLSARLGDAQKTLGRIQRDCQEQVVEPDLDAFFIGLKLQASVVLSLINGEEDDEEEDDDSVH